jgi:hypothetical protein
MPASGPALTPHIVAYLDILGLRKMMSASAKDTGESREVLRSYHASVSEALQVLRPAIGSGIPWKHKVFTDNIVLAVPIESTDAETEFGLASINVAEFQLKLALDGWFVRGGISLGWLYFDDDIVFGPGLVDAYELESQSAVDPRVILSDNVRKLVKAHLKYYAIPYKSPQNGYVFVDVDECQAINYLYVPVGVNMDRKQLLRYVKKHKQQVEGKLRTFAKEPKVWAKYRWVANYHNFFCK